MISFSERSAGEGLICVAEVRITMIQGFTSPGSTIDMLIEFRESCFQISLVKIPNTMNAASGYVISSLHRVQLRYFKSVDVSAWG